MTTYSDRLTIKQAQTNQPWAVPYSAGVQDAHDENGVPHILGTHTVLHAIKSLGKIAAVYEARDHYDEPAEEDWTDADQARWVGERDTIRAMAADLLTAALRFANLEGFDLAEALVERVKEKNGGADFGAVPELKYPAGGHEPHKCVHGAEAFNNLLVPIKDQVFYCERCKGCHAAPECP